MGKQDDASSSKQDEPESSSKQDEPESSSKQDGPAKCSTCKGDCMDPLFKGKNGRTTKPCPHCHVFIKNHLHGGVSTGKEPKPNKNRKSDAENRKRIPRNRLFFEDPE